MQSEKWIILDTGTNSPEHNMKLDAKLLESISGSRPILHLYDWKGSCGTFGHFINPKDYLDLSAAEKCGLKLARRPTGGGIIFHLTDFAFSVVIPAGHQNYSLNTLENYAFINNIVIEVVKQFLGKQSGPSLLATDLKAETSTHHFCMAKPTKYDVMMDGRKIGGAAQRRTKKGFLHQGSISIALPSEEFLKCILLSESSVIEAMKANTFSLLTGKLDLRDIQTARNRLRGIFIAYCSR